MPGRLSAIPEAVRVALAGGAASVLLLLTAPISTFNPAGYIDPWFYTGYFLNFSYLMRHVAMIRMWVSYWASAGSMREMTLWMVVSAL